jgi:putative DNA primase/helicase
MNNLVDQFRQAIAATGLDAPDVIHEDGAIHRFSTNGKRGDESGWYVLYLDCVAAGSFGDWRSGLVSSWCSKTTTDMTQAEQDAHRSRVQAMRAQRDADLAQRHQQTSESAALQWAQAWPAPANYPYLVAKGIRPYGLRIFEGKLLVPMRDTAGTLHSLQSIGEDGDKRFYKDGRVSGCYHSIGKPAGLLIVCEGFATGASIHEATGQAVAVAFNSGNLGRVAMALHKKYPDLAVILAADDDWRTEGNPGTTAAKSAALSVGGFTISPQFPGDRPPKATDFNDLAALAGLAAVRECFSEIEGFVC